MNTYEIENDCGGQYINDCPFPECKCAKLELEMSKLHFVSLEAIDAALQNNATKEQLLRGIRNSINMGYKLVQL